MATLGINEQTIWHSAGQMEGPRGDTLRRWLVLYSDFSSWRSQYIELSDNILPRRGRFLLEPSQASRGRRRSGKMMDSLPTYAARTLSAGLLSGMTSPARPWFKFVIDDEDLMANGPVRRWLSAVNDKVASVLHKANFYTLAPVMYEELGVFGTAAMHRYRDPETVIRFRLFTAGEYVIAEDHTGRVDTLGRKFTMTTAQIVEQFATRPDGKLDFGTVSSDVEKLWKAKNYDFPIPVIHMAQPRPQKQRKGGPLDPRSKRFSEVYMEEATDKDDVLMEGGADKFQFYAVRWDAMTGDIYGRSPGMDALADIKQLHFEVKRKGQAIDTLVFPPMTAPASMKGKPLSQRAGGTTYLDVMSGQQGFQPAFQIRPQLGEMMEDIRDIKGSINHGFYADLFAMMMQSDRRQITATEVAERHEEKLLLLGPVLQRLNTELLDPMLGDIFDFLVERDELPAPPQEIADMDLKVQYTSLLHQAMLAVGAGTIERTVAFAGNMAAVFPKSKLVINEEVAVRRYAQILGADPDIIRDAKEVEEMAAAEAEQAQQAVGMEQAGQAAQAAKVLSEADTQRPNALTALLGSGETV